MSTRENSSLGGKPIIAVEIGTEWLKMAHVEPRRAGVSVTGWHVQRLDSDGPAATQVLKKAVAGLGGAKLPVIACLQRHLVNIRALELPSVDPEEIADMVDLQIGKQTPYSRDEIVSDYRVVGAVRDGYSLVLLAIVQRNVLRQHYGLLDEAGLDVVRMSVSSEAILNWCALNAPEASAGAVAVLDVDAASSDLIVFSRGRLAFTRSIRVGGEQLTAEPGPWREKLAQEVGRSMEMSEGDVGGMKPERMIVTGAGPAVEGLGDFLAGQLGLAVELRDSLAGLGRSAQGRPPAEDEWRFVSLTPIAGMALAPGALEFNLVPDSVALKRSLLSRARALTMLGIAVMVLMFSLSLYAVLRLALTRSRLTRLRGEVEATSSAAVRLERMKEVARVVERRQDPTFAAINLLPAIHAEVPPDVFFEAIEIDMDREQVLLSGSSKSRMDIQTLVNSIEKTPLFRDVKAGTTKKNADTDRYDFQVSCALEAAR